MKDVTLKLKLDDKEFSTKMQVANELYDDLKEQFENGSRELGDSIGGLKAKLRTLKTVFESTEIDSDEFKQLAKDIKKVQNELDKAESAVKDLDETVDNSSGSILDNFSKWGNVVTGINQALEIAGKLHSVTDKFTDTAGMFEDFTTEYEVLLGSVGDAMKRIEQLAEFGANTPFELPGIVKADKQLQTLTRGFLNNAEGLKLVGDVSSGVGQPIEELASWFGRLYDGIDSGRPVGEALMRLQELGALSGQARGKIEDLQKANADSTEVWKVVTDEMGKFSGMMQKKSATYNGMISNLQDASVMFFNAVGQQMLPQAKEIVTTLKTMVEFITPVETHLEIATKKARQQQIEFNILASAYERLGNKINKTASEKKYYNEIINKLQTNYGEHLGNINLEIEAYENVKIAINKARESLIEKAKAEAVLAGNKDLNDKMKEESAAIVDLEGKYDKLKNKTYSDYVNNDFHIEGVVNKDEWEVQKEKSLKLVEDDIAEHESKILKISDVLEKRIKKYGDLLSKALKTEPGKDDDGSKNQGKIKKQEKALKDYYNNVKWLDKDYEEYRYQQIEKEALELEKSSKGKVNIIKWMIAEEKKYLEEKSNYYKKLNKDEVAEKKKSEKKKLKEEKKATEERKKIKDEYYKYAEFEDENYFAREVQLIDEMTQKVIESGLTQVEAEKYKMLQLKQLEDDYYNYKWDKYLQDHQVYATGLESMWAGYDTFWNTILDADMTGAQRSQAIWSSMKNAFVQMLAEMIKQYIANLIMRSVIGTAMQAAEATKAIALGATMATAYAPAATYASVMSFGGAAIAGSASLSAAVALAEANAIPKAETGGWLSGKRHDDGGVIIEAEDGEAVISRKNASKHKNLTNALMNDNIIYDDYDSHNIKTIQAVYSVQHSAQIAEASAIQTKSIDRMNDLLTDLKDNGIKAIALIGDETSKDIFKQGLDHFNNEVL